MIERALQHLALLKFVGTVFGWINHLPLPYGRIPIKVYNHRMVGHTLDRFMALWLWKFGWLEATEAKLIVKFCRPGMQVVDIGANVGLYTLLLAECVGPKGRIWAFEPDPDNFVTLQKNAHLNNYQTIKAINKAVGPAVGAGYLYISKSHSGDHRIYGIDQGRTGTAVQIVSLDNFFSTNQRIDLIKMDIQGAEGLALQGMKNILRNNPGLVIFMEFWPVGLRQAGSIPEQLLTDLQELGFTIAQIDEQSGALHPIDNPHRLVASLPGKQHINLLMRSMRQ